MKLERILKVQKFHDAIMRTIFNDECLPYEYSRRELDRYHDYSKTESYPVEETETEFLLCT